MSRRSPWRATCTPARPGPSRWRPAGSPPSITVTAGDHTADAKSVLGVMGLGATSGQHLTVEAAGPDAREAVAALIAILGQATKVGG